MCFLESEGEPTAPKAGKALGNWVGQSRVTGPGGRSCGDQETAQVAWGKKRRHCALETQDKEASLEILEAGEQGQVHVHTSAGRLFVALWIWD